MKDAQIQYFKTKLHELRADLLESLKSRYDEAINLGTDTGKDSADEAYSIYSRNLMLGRVETDALKLRLVEQALNRIREGTYGVCMECGEEIEERRLEYVPFARYCTECKSELEKKGVIKM
jgi:DnaK suppressor protein